MKRTLFVIYFLIHTLFNLTQKNSRITTSIPSIKKRYLLVLFVCISHSLFAQLTSIPDPIFETFLEANSMGNGIAGDHLVTTANIQNVGTLNVQNLNISSLTGIEDFTGLTSLRCFNNNLIELDLSANTNLILLLADGNSLESINLNGLTVLNFVTLHDNALAVLDISNNPTLGSLTAWNNSLTSIDLTNCAGLAELYLQDNMLTDVDLSSLPNLGNIDVTNNALTSLNLKSGGNGLLGFSSSFLATGNPNLECITVDAAAYSYATWENIDPTTSFSVDCAATTYVPDPIFEDYLETHDASGAIVPLNDPTSMGNGVDDDNLVKTPRIERVTTLNIPMLNIIDLTGIEDFVALETLSCFLNQLPELDVSSNVNLQVLAAGNNSITQLDVKNNIALQSLSIDNNTISELDLSNNALLTSVSVSNNGLVALDMKNGTNGNVSTFFSTGNPDLSCINVDNAAAAAILSSWTTDPTTSFEVGCNETNVPDTSFENYLETHSAAGGTVPVGDLTSMGNGTDADGIVYTTRIENVTGLSMPFKGIANLIGIEDFTALETLSCPFNDIVEIDLSSNLALTSLNALTNDLESLDVSNNTNLTFLSISSNDIQSLDVSNNSALTYIAVANNELTFLNLQNGNNGNVTNFFGNQNSGLTCINVDDSTASYLNNTSIWVKDTAANYGIHCDETYILDPNFEDYLETHNAAGEIVLLNDPSSMGNGIDGDNYVLTSNINTVTNLNVASKGISDFTGIENFVELTFLNVTSNTNTSIDVSSLPQLETLLAHSTLSITSVNVTGLTNLTYLRVNNTSITNLDISTNVSLDRLWAFGLPSISGIIDTTNNPLIRELVISNSGLTGALDVSHLTSLTYLECRDNDFSDLNVNNGNNNNVTFFNATGNSNLTCIHVDDD